MDVRRGADDHSINTGTHHTFLHHLSAKLTMAEKGRLRSENKLVAICWFLWQCFHHHSWKSLSVSEKWHGCIATHMDIGLWLHAWHWVSHYLWPWVHTTVVYSQTHVGSNSILITICSILRSQHMCTHLHTASAHCWQQMNSWFQTSNLLLHHGIPNMTAVQEGNSHHSTKGKLLFALLCRNTTVGRDSTCVHEYNSHCCTLLPATEIVTACTCGDVTLPSPPSTTQSLRQSLVVPTEMSLYHHFPQSLGQSAVPVNSHSTIVSPSHWVSQLYL